jgi:hypothetical protein
MDPQFPHSPQAWVDALGAVGFFTTVQTANGIYGWAAESDQRPLVIQGGQLAGKTALANAIINVLEGGADAEHAKTVRVPYSQRLSFEQFFFEWDGHMRQQVISIMKQLNRPPEEGEAYPHDPKLMEVGMLLRALRAAHDPSYVLIHNFDGPEGVKTDEALAEFITRHHIHIPELRTHEERPDGKRLRVLVTLSSSKAQEAVARGRFYEALKTHGRWVTMDALDRKYQFYVLSRRFPKLHPQAIKELILFIERFNARPDVDYEAMFGEVIEVANALEKYHKVARLTPEIITGLGIMFAKSPRSSEVLKNHAGDIMREVQNMTF